MISSTFVLSEDSLHYVAWILSSYEDKHPTAKHLNTMKEFRDLSNKLLETLEAPMKINVHRHIIKKDI